MRIAVKFEAFNSRKYSKPWIGIVTAWPIGGGESGGGGASGGW